MRIAIIAALPGELKPLVKSWRPVATGSRGVRKWIFLHGGDTWIAVCAGMGAEAARRAYVASTVDGAVDMLFSIGWAGALQADIVPGTAHVPAIVLDAQTGEQFGLSHGGKTGRLVTTARVADAAEKSRLLATYAGAALVDMEAATVMRLGAMHRIPVVCIKGVSDAAGAVLPDLNHFIDPGGQMRMPQFLAHVALRPKYWPSLVHLGRNSARAAEAMRDLIHKFMEEKNVEQLIRTGSIR
jgi:adenosylhomocysteine nucleosidase